MVAHCEMFVMGHIGLKPHNCYYVADMSVFCVNMSSCHVMVKL